VDDQIIVADKDDDLQYNMKISNDKAELVEFERKDDRKVKIVVNNKMIEQILNFTYFIILDLILTRTQM
jgi:hypothetical protein